MTSLSALASSLNELYRLSSSPRFHAETVAVTGVDVSRTGLRFLSLISDSPRISATRIAAALDVSQPTASRVLQQLEDAGLVTRLASKSDGRVSHYVETRKGKRALAKVHAHHVSTLEAALADVDPARRVELTAAVTELVELLQPEAAATARTA